MTLIFDTETTGLPKHPTAKDSVQPRIIEFAAVVMDERGSLHREKSVLINPGVSVPEEITKITGLTDDDLRNASRFAEVMEEIKVLFASAERMIAHNLPFDCAMVRMELERLGVKEWPWPSVGICTVQEHAEEWGRFPKLVDLYEHYTGEPLGQTHRALDDVKALAELCLVAGLIV